MYLNELKNKSITVLGLGLSGMSTVRFLARNNLAFRVIDSREFPPNAAEAQKLASSYHFGDLADADLANCDVLIISPGLPLANPHVQEVIAKGVEVIGDVELFARINTKPVYAVTGSNGKSSVVTLASKVLTEAGFSVALAGNIGTPVLDVVDGEYDCFVLELSSFQLETTYSLKCKASCVLNLSEDHMDRYESLTSYQQAKLAIHRNSERVVINQDDTLTHYKHALVTSFGLKQADYYLADQYFMHHDKVLCSVDQLSVLGTHNQLNALAVMALLDDLALEKTVFIRTFKHFHGLPHRCQLVVEVDGVKYINDSKATNVGATVAAIRSLANDKNIILIAGGVGKGADFTELQVDIERSVKKLIVFGQDAKLIAKLEQSAESVDSLEQAVKMAKASAVKGDLVLFAPACASFDMFKSFEHRGDVFIDCVNHEVQACQ